MNCDLCGSSRATELFTSTERRFGIGGRFSIVRCAECGLVRTEPQPDDLGRFYPSDRYYSYRVPNTRALMRAVVRRAYGLPYPGGRLFRVAVMLTAWRLGGVPPAPPGDLLDVGCGSGAFLLLLEDAGWRCSGVEIDPGAVEEAHEAGLEHVRQGDFLQAGYPNSSMDVVRFWHSLEHLRSPRAALAEARRILRPGGKLVVGVPNFGSLLSRSFRDRWFPLEVPRHLWHFDRARLHALALQAGFEVQRIRNITTTSAILGTIDYLRGRSDTLAENRLASHAVQPLTALLDVLRLGDELELIAIAPRSGPMPRETPQ
jgi:SAM-dependent methyltransferase